MGDGHFLGFVGVALVVILSPGQDTVLTIRNTLGGGRSAGIATALGVVSGQLVWGLATSAGLAALLMAFEPGFRALRLAGAAYLIWLGARSLVEALRRGAPHRVDGIEGARRVTAGVAYRQGLLSNLGNAKVAVFFTSLLPQFVPAGEAFVARLFPLVLVFASITLAWLALYVAAIDKVGDLLRRGPVRRAIDAVSGAVLVAFGVRMAAEEK
jgi:threonine/homoserine/homoserine lactone efflux protein